MDSYRPAGRIYLYVSGGPGGKHPFTNGTRQDMESENLVPVPGMRVNFYCDDANAKGEPDYLLFTGVIDRSEDGHWYAVVDDDRFWHESDIRPEISN